MNESKLAWMWVRCALPGTFPENFKIKSTEKGKEKGLVVNYPCVVLNKMVVDHNTNDQYQVILFRHTLLFTSVITTPKT